jgi:hypothetical protein
MLADSGRSPLAGVALPAVHDRRSRASVAAQVRGTEIAAAMVCVVEFPRVIRKDRFVAASAYRVPPSHDSTDPLPFGAMRSAIPASVSR